jgi:hypothetical protein
MPRPLDFGEPWTAKPTQSWESAFHTPPQGDDPEVRARWESARDRAGRDAEWIVWGSRLARPGVAYSLTGLPAVFDDQAVISRVGPLATHRTDLPAHGQFATRIAACVTACAGITNPVATIEGVRELLFDLLNGRTDATDPRILAYAGRLLRPDRRWPDEDEAQSLSPQEL